MCSDGMSGPQLQVWDHKKQAAFIITHKHCDIKVIDEHDDRYDHYCDLKDGSWEDHIRYGEPAKGK